jgi:Arc/MetJ-type ribon-helix-helix transcriptional regulator
MRKTVQARLDLETERILGRLVRRLDRSPSEVVREGLRLLDSCQSRRAASRIVGLGKFDSGVPDLGSNKKHLEGLGE